eukprot:9415249-Lingulodinium_polyedra.AAC.1
MRRGVSPGTALCCGDAEARRCTTPHQIVAAANTVAWSDIVRAVIDRDPALRNEGIALALTAHEAKNRT